MFPYFGSKESHVRLYPAPRYPYIIEPFCGSARYSLHHRANRQVWLNDYEWRIAEVWKFLTTGSVADIDALPDIKADDYLPAMNLSRQQRLLLSYAISRNRETANKRTSWSMSRDQVGCLKRRWRKYLNDIRDWRITNLHYAELPNIEATWFIDPPYTVGGHNYRHHDIDYQHLAQWCKERKGQVIVCENDFANWLPFTPLYRKRLGDRIITEAVYLQ